MRKPGMILALTLLFGGCWVSSHAVQASPSPREVKVEKTLPAQGIRQVKAMVQVGSVRVFADRPGSVQVKAVCRAKGGSPGNVRRWLEETKVLIKRQGAAIVVKDIVPEDLQKLRSGKPDVRLEVDIHMPPGLALDISSGVGDVEVEGQVGDLTVKSGVGDVQLKRLRCTGKGIDVHAGVGDIVMALQSLPSRSAEVNVGVGEVQISLPSQAKASITMSTGVGELKSGYPLTSPQRGIGQVGGTMAGEVNGGGTRIEIKVGTGDIQLEKSAQ